MKGPADRIQRPFSPSQAGCGVSEPLRVLIPRARIAARVEELARQISADYAAANEVLLVGVLRGAFIFLADLSRRLTIPRAVDFIALARYEHRAEASGDVRLVMDLRVNVAGRHVLVVEDIVDSGHTLAYLVAMLRARGAADVRTCVLTRKARQPEVAVAVDYLGFELPDEWAVGYGLDFNDRYRTLPDICALDRTSDT
jgi:hypoxanthine phosphoribosyltransferase